MALLTNPTEHGGRASDAFDVVIPSLPGHGFSGKPTTLGWDPVRVARAWIVLMRRLGYTRYVAQGGDWGNAVTEQMASQAPPELVAIHANMPATVPDEIAEALQSGGPPPAGPAVRGAQARFRVLIDGRPLGAAHGTDIDDQGVGTVTLRTWRPWSQRSRSGR